MQFTFTTLTLLALPLLSLAQPTEASHQATAPASAPHESSGAAHHNDLSLLTQAGHDGHFSSSSAGEHKLHDHHVLNKEDFKSVMDNAYWMGHQEGFGELRSAIHETAKSGNKHYGGAPQYVAATPQKAAEKQKRWIAALEEMEYY